jgi:FMN phosphatase YigB (HAD superfamily)
MANNIKNIIFDWGRTLYDPDAEQLFPGVQAMLPELGKKYSLYIVSLASKGEGEILKRRKMIKDFGIESYFQDIFFAPEDKDSLYEGLVAKYELDLSETVVVDDRIIRGIAWGNLSGATTVWFQNGKFASELPTAETGEPTHRITAFTELQEIFL